MFLVDFCTAVLCNKHVDQLLRKSCVLQDYAILSSSGTAMRILRVHLCLKVGWLERQWRAFQPFQPEWSVDVQLFKSDGLFRSAAGFHWSEWSDGLLDCGDEFQVNLKWASISPLLTSLPVCSTASNSPRSFNSLFISCLTRLALVPSSKQF